MNKAKMKKNLNKVKFQRKYHWINIAIHQSLNEN